MEWPEKPMWLSGTGWGPRRTDATDNSFSLVQLATSPNELGCCDVHPAPVPSGTSWSGAWPVDVCGAEEPGE